MNEESIKCRTAMLRERREKTGRQDLSLSREKQSDFIIARLKEDIRNLETLISDYQEGMEETMHNRILEYLSNRFNDYLYIPKSEKCYPYFSYRGYDFLINMAIYVEIQLGIPDHYRNRESNVTQYDIYFFQRGIWPKDSNFADARLFSERCVIDRDDIWTDIEDVKGYVQGYFELIRKIDTLVKSFEYTENMPVYIEPEDQDAILDDVYQKLGFYLFFEVINIITGDDDRYGKLMHYCFSPWQRDIYMYTHAVYMLHLLFGVAEKQEEFAGYDDETLRNQAVYYYKDEYNAGYHHDLYKGAEGKLREPYTYKKDNDPLRPEIYNTLNSSRIRFGDLELYILPCLDPKSEDDIDSLLYVYDIAEPFKNKNLEDLLEPEYFELSGISRKYTYKDEKTAYEVIRRSMEVIEDISRDHPKELKESIEKLFAPGSGDHGEEIIGSFLDLKSTFVSKGFSDKGRRLIEFLKHYDTVDHNFKLIKKQPNESIRRHSGYVSKKMKNKYISHEGMPKELIVILFSWSIVICNLLDDNLRKEKTVTDWFQTVRDFVRKLLEKGKRVASGTDAGMDNRIDHLIDQVLQFIKDNYSTAQNGEKVILRKEVLGRNSELTLMDASGNPKNLGTRDELSILQDADLFREGEFKKLSEHDQQRYYLFSFAAYIYRSMKGQTVDPGSVEESILDISKVIIDHCCPEKLIIKQ